MIQRAEGCRKKPFTTTGSHEFMGENERGRKKSVNINGL
jgi:hypothetical protein